MTDVDDRAVLRTALRAAAEAWPPVRPDLPTIRRRARRRRAGRTALAAAATCVVLAAVPVVTQSLRTDASVPPLAPAPVLVAVPPDAVALFASTDVPSTILYSDRDAAAHGWTVVVRSRAGGFARDGAVVTYPVEPPVGASTGDRVDLAPGVQGRTVPGGITWPVDDGWARVRGDLPPALLVRIAASVQIDAGRPVVRPPDGYRVVVTTPSVPAEVAEARYAGWTFGVPNPSAPDGGKPLRYEGLGFTQVLLSGGLEDDVYAALARGDRSITRITADVPTAARPGEGRAGTEVLRTNLVGGNGDVMWEVRPGVAAIVGVSGSTPDPLDIALRSRLVDAATWRATGPQEIPQSNAFVR